MEAELRAARERAIVPLEARMTQFKDMLLERGVTHPFLKKKVCLREPHEMNCSHLLRFSFHCTCSEMSNLSGFCQTRGHCLVLLLSFLPVGVCILNLGQRTPQDCF